MLFPTLPLEFSQRGRANVMAAEVVASRAIAEVPPAEREEIDLIQYIMTVFSAFAHEACELGKSKWSADQIVQQVHEFLRMLLFYTQSKYDPDDFNITCAMTSDRTGDVSRNFKALLEKTPYWSLYQDELLGVTAWHALPETVAATPTQVPPAPKTIGEQLDEIVLDRPPLSHEQLADDIGISRSAYFEVKAGRGGKKVKAKTLLYLSNRSKRNAD